ncbi:MAG: hypothetical protein AVDCRST_MAG86-109 [uncultured Truepera sp.]|uniref:Uncharacterized protein n=1 Tax=uncultured Truepera sp. TaxID=543023 RepID=A0A6J4UM86_9DEIN|nr:MAG: hypothetical protein AVDCRST_MAG86-109 [uncultured Truepera sp.]
MLIGQATLRSAAFCPRLTMLIRDLQNAGYTVWLEGLSVRFDHENSQEVASPPKVLNELIGRYGDVVEWVPEPILEAAAAYSTGEFPAPRCWNPLSRRGQGVTQR